MSSQRTMFCLWYFLSYQEAGRFRNLKVNLSRIVGIDGLARFGGQASSAKVTFIPVLRRSHHFSVGIGSNAHEQCVTRCPVSRLVHSPFRPASVITWDPS